MQLYFCKINLALIIRRCRHDVLECNASFTKDRRSSSAIYNANLDFTCITESWLKNHIDDNFVLVSGYNIIRREKENVLYLIYHINCCVIQGFPALRKAVTTHMKKYRIYLLPVLIEPISCLHVTRL